MTFAIQASREHVRDLVDPRLWRRQIFFQESQRIDPGAGQGEDWFRGVIYERLGFMLNHELVRSFQNELVVDFDRIPADAPYDGDFSGVFTRFSLLTSRDDQFNIDSGVFRAVRHGKPLEHWAVEMTKRIRFSDHVLNPFATMFLGWWQLSAATALMD